METKCHAGLINFGSQTTCSINNTGFLVWLIPTVSEDSSWRALSVLSSDNPQGPRHGILEIVGDGTWVLGAGFLLTLWPWLCPPALMALGFLIWY